LSNIMIEEGGDCLCHTKKAVRWGGKGRKARPKPQHSSEQPSGNEDKNHSNCRWLGEKKRATISGGPPRPRASLRKFNLLVENGKKETSKSQRV